MKQTITADELLQLVQTDGSLQLIDVRSPGEYAAGHVPRALNIPLEQVEDRVADLGQGRVAILCQSGQRAGLACEILARHHPDLIVVEGGTQAWADAGLPLTAPEGSRWSLERQVRFLAGLLVLIGAILSLTVDPAWVYLSLLMGAGLAFSGITNFCGMALLLGRLPWNQATARPEIP